MFLREILPVRSWSEKERRPKRSRKIKKRGRELVPSSAIYDIEWLNPDCPWSMWVWRSQKKYFRNFNFNFNYRELLSKSATFSLRGFGVVWRHVPQLKSMPDCQNDHVESGLIKIKPSCIKKSCFDQSAKEP